MHDIWISAGCVLCVAAMSSPLAAQTPPFRDAVRAGDFIYLSGNIGRIPEGKDPHSEGLDVAARAAMDGLGRALARQGATFDDVVKCTVMLADIEDWPRFNESYRTYFKIDRLPARSAFGGVDLAHDAALEVECIAYRPAAAKP